MPVAQELASLAVSAASGVIKLGMRLDRILAEDAALESETAIAIGKVVLPPSKAVMKARLRKLLAATKGERPDPLGADRARLDLIAKKGESEGSAEEIEALHRRYGLAEFEVRTIEPDLELARTLRERHEAWDLADADIRQITYFVSAGADFRENSTVFRISATLLDVLAEFASVQAEFFVRDEKARRLLGSVVARFAEGDLAKLDGWGGLLKQALRATIGGIVDDRALLGEKSSWLELLLSTLARARVASEEGDDFFIGLLRGEGFQLLLRGGLEEVGGRLAADDASALELLLAELLAGVAGRIEREPVGFEAWFQDNWNGLAATTLLALRRHGPGVLDLEDELLLRTFDAALEVLAEGFGKETPSGDLLVAALDAAVAVVADDPALLDEAISRDWLRDLVSGLAGVMKATGVRKAFGRTALEGYGRAVLRTVAEHPEIVDVDSDLVRSLLTEVLGGMAKARTLGIESLGTAVVAGALRAIEAQPGLIDGDFGSVVGDFAGRVAALVEERRLSGVQAAAILEAGILAIADNPGLRDAAKRAVARSVVEAVVAAAGSDEFGLLAGQALVVTTQRLLRVVAARGRMLFGEATASTAIVKAIEEVLHEGLSVAADELGRKLDRSMVPELLAALVEARLEGELSAEVARDEILVILDEVSNAMGVVARLTFIEAHIEEGS